MKLYTMISFLLIACGFNLGQISASEQPLDESMRKHELNCLQSNFKQMHADYKTLASRVSWTQGILYDRISGLSESADRKLNRQISEELPAVHCYLAYRRVQAHAACKSLNESSTQEARQACAGQLEDFFENFSRLEVVLRGLKNTSMTGEELSAFKKENSELLDKINSEGRPTAILYA